MSFLTNLTASRLRPVKYLAGELIQSIAFVAKTSFISEYCTGTVSDRTQHRYDGIPRRLTVSRK